MNEARTSPRQSQCAIRHNTAHPVLRGTLKWLIRKLIRHFRNEKEMEPKYVPQLCLGLLLGTRWSAIGQVFTLSLVTVPEVNRPFYRYGGHIELIRFKEYYRMPRGHEHISFVFSSAFRDIFS